MVHLQWPKRCQSWQGSKKFQSPRFHHPRSKFPRRLLHSKRSLPNQLYNPHSSSLQWRQDSQCSCNRKNRRRGWLLRSCKHPRQHILRKTRIRMNRRRGLHQGCSCMQSQPHSRTRHSRLILHSRRSLRQRLCLNRRLQSHCSTQHRSERLPMKPPDPKHPC